MIKINETDRAGADTPAEREEKMNIRELRKLTGLSQKDFGDRYDIPYRTIQNWETEQRSCPEYVEGLLERVVLEDYGQIVGYVFGWQTNDMFEEEFFNSKQEALRKAEKAWNHLTESEKKKHTSFEVFKVICTKEEWEELTAYEASYTSWDRMDSTIKDFLK